jgi:hypothetical protein
MEFVEHGGIDSGDEIHQVLANTVELKASERGQECVCRRRGTQLEGARFRGGKSDGEVFEIVQWEKEGDHRLRWNVPSVWDIKEVKLAKVVCRQNKVC